MLIIYDLELGWAICWEYLYLGWLKVNLKWEMGNEMVNAIQCKYKIIHRNKKFPFSLT